MNQPLSSLPSVESILNDPLVCDLVERYGRELVVYSVREVIGRRRELLLKGKKAGAAEQIPSEISSVAESIVCSPLKQVVNATGVVLHTNLGRAPLGLAVMNDIVAAASGYTNLEFDLTTGKRGKRNDHVRRLLQYITGAEDVVVVNNNAAAIILILTTFARRKEVIVSRGELIEIGGAFRIPDIMAAGGAKMKEVGTTNRTRVADYESSIGEKTAILFKAHRSNYSISGFTEEASARELSSLGRMHDIPFVYDIGSGLLRGLPGTPVEKEPDVRSALADGADLVTFSCDKLLGGPQAGVIAGRADLVRRLSKAPLMRALRVGKLSLAALSSACRQYLSTTSLTKDNPAFGMFTTAPDELRAKAGQLAGQLEQKGVSCEVLENNGYAGGGSLPDAAIPSFAVALIPPGTTVREKQGYAERVHRFLLSRDRPVVGILREGRIMFDILTLLPGELEYLSSTLSGFSRT